MVNSKLSSEDEDMIYMEWLAGRPLAVISKNFPVVPSTLHRVIKRKKIVDDGVKSHHISNSFKHVKSATESLNRTISLIDLIPNGNIHPFQKSLLLESLDELQEKIDIIRGKYSPVKSIELDNVASSP